MTGNRVEEREETSSDAKQDRVRTDSFLAVEITASSAGGTAKSRDREEENKSMMEGGVA